MMIRGKIKSVKAGVDSQGFVKREVTLVFSDDAVIDELAELMKRNETLTVTLVAQQLRLGETPAVANGGKR